MISTEVSTDRGINEQNKVYMHNKKNEMPTKGVEMEDTILNEITRHRKTNITYSLSYVRAKKVDLKVEEHTIVTSRGWKGQREVGPDKGQITGTKIEGDRRNKVQCSTAQEGNYRLQKPVLYLRRIRKEHLGGSKHMW